MTRKPTAHVFGEGATPVVPVAHAALKAWVGVAEGMGGSRRRSLWELGNHAHCPVMGVCLPLAQLRRLMRKVGVSDEGRSDYELHLIAVNECRRRTPLAEQVQRNLDQRFDLAIQAVRGIKCSEGLATHWAQAVQQPEWGAAMWAVLTHPACNTVLEHELLGQVHMLQHQVGMSTRINQQQWDGLRQAYGKTQAELLAWQGRCQLLTQEATQRQQDTARDLQKMRDAWLQEQALHQKTQAELVQLRQGAVGLEERLRLKSDNDSLRQQVAVLERALRRGVDRGLNDAPVSEARRAEEEPAQRPESGCQVLCGKECQRRAVDGAHGLPRKVVCVGGRAGQVPAYREVVETQGAEFLYHDGGEEDSLNRLQGALSAADWVICQVGCISHNAYWRVKEHCKRTGTPCAFIDNPSKSAMARAMRALAVDQPAA